MPPKSFSRRAILSSDNEDPRIVQSLRSYSKPHLRVYGRLSISSSSEDVPLSLGPQKKRLKKQHRSPSQSTLPPTATRSQRHSESSDDVPLCQTQRSLSRSQAASRHRLANTPRRTRKSPRHLHNSPHQLRQQRATKGLPSDHADSDTSIFTPRREKAALQALATAQRLKSLNKGQANRSRPVYEDRRLARESFFDDLLEELADGGYNLVEFLEYVFVTATTMGECRWKGFFAHKKAVLRILNAWLTSAYPLSARQLIIDWALKTILKVVGQEAKKITEDGILRMKEQTVNEEFLLSFMLSKLTSELKSYVPTMFTVFEAFSTTTRQEREMSADGMRKKELVGVNCSHHLQVACTAVLSFYL